MFGSHSIAFFEMNSGDYEGAIKRRLPVSMGRFSLQTHEFVHSNVAHALENSTPMWACIYFNPHPSLV